MKKKKPKTMETVLYALVILVLAVTALNQYQISKFSGMVVGSVASVPNTDSSGNIDVSQFMPKGIPSIYGSELKVSFDDVVGSLSVLSAMDWDLTQEDSPNGMSMKFSDLTDDQKARYIKIDRKSVV